MTPQFGRPVSSSAILTPFISEAGRLRRFVPPFRFTSFFSPEDTLLCAVAAEAALARGRASRRKSGWQSTPMKIAELTTGSGLVGLHLLSLESGSHLVGFDVDPRATVTASNNANLLGFGQRARFACADLWSDDTLSALGDYRPNLIVCNPPYIPEPPGTSLQLEAGAAFDGTAHLIRTIELAERVRPRALALSWCSLSDPWKVIRRAQAAGYMLNSLYIVAIADGEYSGSVRDYLHTLRGAYLSELPEDVDAVAPDRSARFVYLLMAGDFSRRDHSAVDLSAAPEVVERICRNFAREGLSSLRHPIAPFLVRTWLLDRWDELRLRASLHGNMRSVETTA
ncbi:MAG: methyltransferase [Gemmatimonadaceae bacterium]